VLLIVIWAAGCVDLAANDRTITVWETQLTPEVSYPGVSGQAAAVSDRDGTTIGIAIEGATPGGQHVWAMGLAGCAAPGQQIGPDTDYPVLVVSDSGRASVETHLGAHLARSSAYHVQVQESATDSSRVACGNLVAR
jgi:hypothetical protein